MEVVTVSSPKLSTLFVSRSVASRFALPLPLGSLTDLHALPFFNPIRLPVSLFISRMKIKNGLPIENGLQETAAIIDALVGSKFNGGQDDRKFLLEQGLVFLSRYPNESILKKTLTDKVITVLYQVSSSTV